MEKFIKVNENSTVDATNFSEYLKANSEKLYSYATALATAAEMLKEHCNKCALTSSDIFGMVISLNYFSYASQDITQHTQSMLKALNSYVESVNDESRREVSEASSKEN